MSLQFDGTDDFGEHAAAILTATAVSMLVWGKPTSALKNACLMSLCTSGTANHSFTAEMESDGDFRAMCNSTLENASTMTNVVTLDAWQMFVVVFASATSRFAYRNATQGPESTTSRTPTGINYFMLGDRQGVTEHFNGRLAYPCIWNVALSQTDVTALYNGGAGVDPRTVQNASVVAFWDTSQDQGATYVDEVGAFDLSVTGAAHNADDPFTLGGGGGASVGAGLVSSLALSPRRLVQAPVGRRSAYARNRAGIYVPKRMAA